MGIWLTSNAHPHLEGNAPHQECTSSLTRVDKNGKYIDKVVKVNKLIMDVLEKLSVEVIDNSNIKSEHLAKRGLHLSLGKGNAKLATNLKVPMHRNF